MSRPWEYWRDVEAQEEEHRVIPIDHLTQKQTKGEGKRCARARTPACGELELIGKGN